MRYIKSILFLFGLLLSTISTAQDYKFIPDYQRLLSDEEVKQMPIMITPDIMIFNEQGKILPMSNMQLMANPDYKPLFFADANGSLKSLIFQKRSDHPVLIEENPEAAFTPGEKAYNFLVTDINGNSFKLSDLQGKVVVLNFWFTRCKPCINEMPDLNSLVGDFENENVVFLALTFDKKSTVEQFLYNNSFNYTIAPNANDVVTMYGVQSYPTSIVINQQGEIVHKELGFRTNIKTVLSESIKSLL